LQSGQHGTYLILLSRKKNDKKRKRNTRNLRTY
jgi:hypothetical protein